MCCFTALNSDQRESTLLCLSCIRCDWVIHAFDLRIYLASWVWSGVHQLLHCLYHYCFFDDTSTIMVGSSFDYLLCNFDEELISVSHICVFLYVLFVTTDASINRKLFNYSWSFIFYKIHSLLYLNLSYSILYFPFCSLHISWQRIFKNKQVLKYGIISLILMTLVFNLGVMVEEEIEC